MRILLLSWNLHNQGGLIGHQMNLYVGLQELGHTVVHRKFEYWDTEYPPDRRRLASIEKEQTFEGYPMKYDKYYGTVFTRNDKINPHDKFWNEKYRDYINDNFDVILFHTPIITKSKDNKGYNDWMKIYMDTAPKKFVVVHDANFWKQYPWLTCFADKIDGAIAVHGAGYDSLKKLDTRISMIPNPFDLSGWDPSKNKPLHERELGFMSVAFWKKWKRFQDICRGIPFMSSNYRKILGGKGLEYAYMTAPVKVKTEYLWGGRKKLDYDYPEEFKGKYIFNIAQDFGMEYVGMLTFPERDKLMQDLMFHFDAAYNLGWGEHFNRTTVEAMINGQVPICRPHGISDNAEGNGILLNGRDNVFLIDDGNIHPREFGSQMDKIMSQPLSELQRRVDNNYKLVPKFDRKYIADLYIRFMSGDDTASWDGRVGHGSKDSALFEKGSSVLRDHFNIDPVNLVPLAASASSGSGEGEEEEE